MTFFLNTAVSLCSNFLKTLKHDTLFFFIFSTGTNANYFAVAQANNYPPASETVRRTRTTYEGRVSVPLLTSSDRDSEIIQHRQKAYTMFFSVYYNK